MRGNQNVRFTVKPDLPFFFSLSLTSEPRTCTFLYALLEYIFNVAELFRRAHAPREPARPAPRSSSQTHTPRRTDGKTLAAQRAIPRLHLHLGIQRRAYKTR